MLIKGAFPVRWAAQDGKGVSVTMNVIQYATGTSGTTKPTSGWSTSVPSVSNGSYLWTWTHIEYSDGTATDSYSVSRMGIDGRGIQRSTVTYSQQATSVDPSTITDWGTFPSSLTDGYWLYTKTHIEYTGGSSTDSYSVSQIGTGAFYAGTQEYYAYYDSDSEAPSGWPDEKEFVEGIARYTSEEKVTIAGNWSNEKMPEPTEDSKYLWNFEISYDSRGNKYVTPPICIGHMAKSMLGTDETYATSAYSRPSDTASSYPSDISPSDWKPLTSSAAPTPEKPYLWNKTITYYDDGSDVVRYHICAIMGEQGAKGIDGCILRITEWQENVEYHNDEKLTSGTRYIDIAIKPGATANNYEAYKCRKSHNSSEQPLREGEFWVKFNDLAPIFTPIILATYSRIRFSQTNQLLVQKDDGTIVAGMGGGDYPIWAGASNPEDASFRVTMEGILQAIGAEILGKIIAGATEGKRVEIDPDTKSINIFGENGEVVSIFEGNTYHALSELFNNASGAITLNTNANNTQRSEANADQAEHNNGELNLMNSCLHTTTPTELKVSGSMMVSASVPACEGICLTYSRLNLKVKTFSDSEMNELIAITKVADLGVSIREAQPTGKTEAKRKNLSEAKVKVPAGYHMLVMEYETQAYHYSGDGVSSAVASWGTNVNQGVAISASYNSDFYVSRYFANGLCFGTSNENYIFLRQDADGRMALSCETNGYGFSIDSSGVKTKISGGNFTNIPIVIMRGIIGTDDDKITIRGISTFDGSTFNEGSSSSVSDKNGIIVRDDTGKVTVKFPSGWLKLGLFEENTFVTITGYQEKMKGTLDGITNEKMSFSISDDASLNDGKVIVKIEYFV